VLNELDEGNALIVLSSYGRGFLAWTLCATGLASGFLDAKRQHWPSHWYTAASQSKSVTIQRKHDTRVHIDGLEAIVFRPSGLKNVPNSGGFVDLMEID
jgi:hypothetical protein